MLICVKFLQFTLFNGRNGLTSCLPCHVNCGNPFWGQLPKNSKNQFTLLKQYHSGLHFAFCDITPLFDDRLIWAAQSKLIEV